jgi:hypothetical protein
MPARQGRKNARQPEKPDQEAKLRVIDRERTDQERRGCRHRLELTGQHGSRHQQVGKAQPTAVTGDGLIGPVLGIEMGPALD